MDSPHKENSELNVFAPYSAPHPLTISDTSLLSSQKLVSLLNTFNQHVTDNIPGGARTRPLMTVQPLANDLGLTVDTSCDRDDQDCVANLVDGYDGSGNILICWEHDNLSDIVKALGDNSPPEYPDDS